MKEFCELTNAETGKYCGKKAVSEIVITYEVDETGAKTQRVSVCRQCLQKASNSKVMTGFSIGGHVKQP